MEKLGLMPEKMLLTIKWHAEHPFAGQNTQYRRIQKTAVVAGHKKLSPKTRASNPSRARAVLKHYDSPSNVVCN